MAKQVEMSQSRLSRELDKLNGIVKSEIRMLGAERHRFQMRHKNFKPPRISVGFKARDVNMFYTHTPGFCYHHTGAIKGAKFSEAKINTTKRERNLYESIRDVLFTKNELDLDKVLCLHLLSTHVDGFEECKFYSDKTRLISSEEELLSFIDKEAVANSEVNTRELFDFPWYILKTQHDETKCCKIPNPEDNGLKESELCYRQFVVENKEFSRILQSPRTCAPNLQGKMPIVSQKQHLENPPDENNDHPCTIKTSFSISDEQLSRYNHPAGKIWSQKSSFLKEIEAKAVNLYKKSPKQYIFLQPFGELYKIHDQKYKYRIASICVNKRWKKLVQIVLQSLRMINLDRAKLLERTIRQPDEINKILKKSTVKSFLRSMQSCPFFGSDDFTFLTVLAIEKNRSTENHFKNQIIAKTLQVDSELGFDDFLEHVRRNLYTKIATKNDASYCSPEVETLILSSSRYSEFKKFENDSSLAFKIMSYSQNTSFESLHEQKKYINSTESNPTASKNWRTLKIPSKYDSKKYCTNSSCTSFEPEQSDSGHTKSTKATSTRMTCKQKILPSKKALFLKSKGASTTSNKCILEDEEQEILFDAVELKLRQEISETETRLKLKNFLKKSVN